MSPTNTTQKALFRGYDIRARYPTELNEKTASKIAAAFAKMLPRGEVLIAWDNRSVSKKLARAVEFGMLEQSRNVGLIGMMTVGSARFGLAKSKAAGGIIATASHNPPPYAGIKLYIGHNPLSQSQLLKLAILSARAEEKRKPLGKIALVDFTNQYIEHVESSNRAARKLNVVIDAGNGPAGPLASRIFSKLHDAECVRCTPEDVFVPNPIFSENLRPLQHAVLQRKAAAGVAFDGDADRAVFVDDKGGIVPADQIAMLLAIDTLAKKRAAAIVLSVTMSRAASDLVRSRGGKVFESAVGPQNISDAVKKHRAEFGAEASGHFYFRENFGIDDGLFTAARVFKILAASRKTFSQLRAELPHYHSTRELRIPVKNRWQIVKQLERDLRKGGFKVDLLDGVRVRAEDWWGLCRPSNTEEMLSARFEGKTRADLEEVFELFSTELLKLGVRMPGLKEVLD